MISAVIPAAGWSRRMGAPKLLLPLAGKTIIEHVVDHVAAAAVDEIIVVLGAVDAPIRRLLAARNVKTVYNPRYREGLGTSVAAGAAAVHDNAQWILLINGDQPLVMPSLLDKLIRRAQATTVVYPDKAAHCRTRIVRQSGKGPPMLFHSDLRREIAGLSGDEGCRRLIAGLRDQTVIIPLQEMDMILDVDTPADYRRLQSLQGTVALPATRESAPGSALAAETDMK